MKLLPRRDDDDTRYDDTRYDDEHGVAEGHREPLHHESRHAVVGREREEHGGVKVGVAFLGWLTAMGMVVLLDGRYGEVRTLVRTNLAEHAAVLEDAETLPMAAFRDRVRDPCRRDGEGPDHDDAGVRAEVELLVHPRVLVEVVGLRHPPRRVLRAPHGDPWLRAGG